MTLIPESLSKAIGEGRVVPFVGAGVSRSVTGQDGKTLFPSWGELLQRAAKVLLADGKISKVKRIEGALGDGDFLDAAKHAKDGLGVAAWFQFLKNEFLKDRREASDTSLRLAEAVWRLGCDLVLTTNYDRVLHWTHPYPVDLDIWTPTNRAEFAHFPSRPTVWHVHGEIGRVEELILTPDGYQFLYPHGLEAKHEAARQMLRQLFRERSMLFVGFGMEEAIQEQLRWVRGTFAGAGATHYLLVRESERAAKERDLQGLSVDCVSYPEHGAPLIDLVENLTRLVPSARRVSVIPNYRAEAPNPPALAEEVLSLLPDDEKRLRSHYIQVIWPLTAEPDAWNAIGPGEMVDQLLQFEVVKGETLSRPLVEFLERLHHDPKLESKDRAIANWLDRVPSARWARLAARQKLGQMALVVEIGECREDGRLGELSWFHACLFHGQVPGRTWGPHSVSSWQSFEALLSDVVQEAEESNNEEDALRIEFLLNVQLMDLAPHAIQHRDRSLGSQHPVLLRWRYRHRDCDKAARTAWKRMFHECQCQFRQTPVHPVDGVGCQPGVGFLSVPLPMARGADKRASREAFATLQRVLERGSPFVYWLHSVPKDGDWMSLRECLTTWIKSCRDPDAFLDHLRQQRLEDHGYARQGSLLWDDPNTIRDWKYEEEKR